MNDNLDISINVQNNISTIAQIGMYPKDSPTGTIPSRRRLKLAGILVALLIGLGVSLRIVHLEQRVFWVDEVATVIRAAGYTKAEITAQLATSQPHTAADLLAWQRLSPDRGWIDMLRALSLSPEHAPLYFWLTRLWMQLWGSSVGAVRSLSVLCSLLTLPVMYALGREFDRGGRSRIALIGVVLLAVSPFFVAYAQEARPYSLWLLLIVLSQWALLRAIRLNRWGNWLAYGLALTLSCYTSLLSIPIAIGQGAIGLTLPRAVAQRLWLTLIGVGVALLPWLAVIWQHQAALAANTTWMRTSISPLSIVAIWLYSFAILFFDAPVISTGWAAVTQAIVALLVLAICGWAVLRLGRDRFTRLWFSSLILPIPLTLILLDLILQGQSSATPRYLVPSQLGVLLAVGVLVSPRRRLAHLLLSFLLSLCLLSGWGNLDRTPDYQKAHNRSNPEIAAIVNQTHQPVIWAEAAHTIDLLSLSHDLQPHTEIRILPDASSIDLSIDLLLSDSAQRPTLLLTPSDALRHALAQYPAIELVERYRPALLTAEDVYLTLWQVEGRERGGRGDGMMGEGGV